MRLYERRENESFGFKSIITFRYLSIKSFIKMEYNIYPGQRKFAFQFQPNGTAKKELGSLFPYKWI